MSTVAAVAASSDLIFSVCPPHATPGVVDQVAAAGFTGVYVDANAVSPSTAREVVRVVTIAGTSFVDGGIVAAHPPPAPAPALPRREPRTVGRRAVHRDAPRRDRARRRAGAASALKSLLHHVHEGHDRAPLAIRALARAEGVDDALLAEWAVSQPDLVTRSEAGPRGSARKAWRFPGEMDEIADALADTGIPDGFHRGAAATYRRLDRFKDAPEPPALADLIAELLATSTSDPSPD